MTENPKLDMAETCGSEEKMGAQKISVSDHLNGFHRSDSFVIDMESFSHGTTNKDINPNSRITLQRSLSRKGSQRSDKKNIPNSAVNDRDSPVAASSPRGPSTPEKASAVAVGTTDHTGSPQGHHQITITTGNINAAAESRFPLRRNSFKRSSLPWLLDPKRVLFLFATLSSMGTILLIYFTLTINRMNGDEDVLG